MELGFWPLALFVEETNAENAFDNTDCGKPNNNGN